MVRERPIRTEAEQYTIRDAAAHILADPIFRASERSTKLFRYLVEHALSNDEDALKERRIGHEVFGREVGYDTADDPIVRNAASDVRKRLRQYDAENGAEAPVHILLGAGGYALDFSFRTSSQSLEDGSAGGDFPFHTEASVPQALRLGIPVNTRAPSLLPWWIATVATVACLLFAGAFFWQRQQFAASDRGILANNSLWSPMLNTGKEIFVCLGHAQSQQSDSAAADSIPAGLQRVTITDLKAYTNISGFLQLNRQSFQMRTDNQTTLLDLRDRPTVLIGIMNNQWSLKLTSNLRYHFDSSENTPDNPQRAVSIVDSQHPQRFWRVKAGNVSDSDYAIAGRLLDPITGGLILYVAGAGTVGTQAASEFVTEPAFLKGLPSSLRNPRTNIQVVIRTPIVGGIPGTPEVVATYVY